MTAGLEAAEQKMRAAGLADAAIAAFAGNYRRLAAGESGQIPDDELTPIDVLPAAGELTEDAGADLLDATVVMKLNGGLGTSMGLAGPKSLIEARDGLSFLDITVRQVLALRRRHGARLPLVLMNSFATRDATLAALAAHPELEQDVGVEFVQGQVPKLRADDLTPVSWPADPRLEWAPPGHGDFYAAIAAAGMLDTLLERGYRYALLSNVDNLGAVLDTRILAWFAAGGAPFALETVLGTGADRKGGHLARRADGRIVSRESAQAPEGSFGDVGRWRHYTTNTMWLDLRALAEVLAADGPPQLPLIVNRKTVDPRDPASTPVIQLETAAGAAIGALEGARAISVPRTRFAPVKTTDDLLVLRSDVYRLSADAVVEQLVDRLPVVALDRRHYAHLPDFDQRFPHGPPSLRRCASLTVEGDVTFGRGVVARGDAVVRGGDRPGAVPDGTVLDGTTVL